MRLRLERARLLRGLNQSEVAEKAGLSPGQISDYEAGNHFPSSLNLWKLAYALDVSTDYLLDLAENPETWDAVSKRLDVALTENGRLVYENERLSVKANTTDAARRELDALGKKHQTFLQAFDAMKRDCMALESKVAELEEERDTSMAARETEEELLRERIRNLEGDKDAEEGRKISLQELVKRLHAQIDNQRRVINALMGATWWQRLFHWPPVKWTKGANHGCKTQKDSNHPDEI